MVTYEDIRDMSPQEMKEQNWHFAKEMKMDAWKLLTEDEGELVFKARIGTPNHGSKSDLPNVRVHKIRPEMYTLMLEDGAGYYPYIHTSISEEEVAREAKWTVEDESDKQKGTQIGNEITVVKDELGVDL